MKILTDKTFDTEVRDNGEIAVVMFSAPWAGPCNLVRPDYEEVAARYGNQIDFYEFSLDDNPNIPERYNVKAVPLFIVFNGGVPTLVTTGAIPKKDILSFVRDALGDEV